MFIYWPPVSVNVFLARRQRRDMAPFLHVHNASLEKHFLTLRRAGRSPRLLFEFDRRLFKFRYASPALEPLLQLPPQFGHATTIAMPL
jgi:hypothetical protein